VGDLEGLGLGVGHEGFLLALAADLDLALGVPADPEPASLVSRKGVRGLSLGLRFRNTTISLHDMCKICIKHFSIFMSYEWVNSDEKSSAAFFTTF